MGYRYRPEDVDRWFFSEDAPVCVRDYIRGLETELSEAKRQRNDLRSKVDGAISKLTKIASEENEE